MKALNLNKETKKRSSILFFSLILIQQILKKIKILSLIV
ncbi:hypothetical protein SGODD07_00187 [Streptococcus gordonii]|uniref:Uncharacterized protein n=1 Tax=Streptococcus gordonii TaxID=1302 RepID=A0A139NF53_STRGN|nr:hypothetical protein SGODD07_00187 [Streptococcus gordonii]